MINRSRNLKVQEKPSRPEVVSLSFCLVVIVIALDTSRMNFFNFGVCEIHPILMCQLFPLPCHPAAGERLRELGGWMLEPGDSSSLGKRAWPPSTLEQGSFLVFWW